MSAVTDDTRPGGVQVVLAPFSVSVGHSLELSALAVLAVGLKVAYDHRSREVPLRNEYFDPPIPLSVWMERESMTEPQIGIYKRRSLLDVLREMTVRS
jgi:hypothetical protein